MTAAKIQTKEMMSSIIQHFADELDCSYSDIHVCIYSDDNEKVIPKYDIWVNKAPFKKDIPFDDLLSIYTNIDVFQIKLIAPAYIKALLEKLAYDTKCDVDKLKVFIVSNGDVENLRYLVYSATTNEWIKEINLKYIFDN